VAAFAVAAWWTWRHPGRDEEPTTVVWATTAATAWGMVVSGSRRTPPVARLGYDADPVGSFAKGQLCILGAHWSHLTPVQRLLLPATFAGWLASSLHRHRRVDVALVVRLLELLPVLVCTWRGNDLLDAEARRLERDLQDEFTDACGRARAQATTDELDRYDRQLGVARRALSDLGAAVPPDHRRELDRDCDELEDWLAGQRRSLGRPPG
jgi:hypothetical protein